MAIHSAHKETASASDGKRPGTGAPPRPRQGEPVVVDGVIDGHVSKATVVSKVADDKELGTDYGDSRIGRGKTKCVLA